MKEIFEIFNWRFFWFMGVAFLPIWSGLIACVVVMVKEKANEVLHRR